MDRDANGWSHVVERESGNRVIVTTRHRNGSESEFVLVREGDELREILE